MKEMVILENFKIETSQIGKLKYVIRYPKEYQKDNKYPIIVLLHGAGGRGNDINVLLNNPYFRNINNYEDFKFITVAPLCSADTWFDLFGELKNLVIEISKREFTDDRKIYLMGASMGAYATWQLAMSMPEYFAAIIPICGGGMYWNAARLVNVPVWAFHGKKDSVVFVEESEKMINAVNKNGGNAKITIYPENEHDAWNDTYSNPKVFNWLLKHENQNNIKIENIYNDSDIYG